MKYGPETKTVEAFFRHLKRMTPREWDAAGAAADWAAAKDIADAAAWAAARDIAGAAAWDAAWGPAGGAADQPRPEHEERVMSERFTHTLSLSIGGDEPIWEGEATVSYLVTWGAPEQGPSYASGGQPADPDEIDDITVTHIDGRPVASRGYGKHEAETLATHIECSDRLMDELLEAAAEEAAAVRSAYTARRAAESDQ